MRKGIVCILLAAVCCVGAFSAQASQMLRIYLDKDALLTHDISAADIRVRPEGVVRVKRHSLWPWDEDKTKWSLFVEIENISDEKIVVDENWLIACKANRSEIASAEGIVACSNNVMDPGERIVLHAGAYPYPKDKRNNADVALDIWDVEGMADFANRIRQAEVLCVRLNTRGEESSKNWPEMEIRPEIGIDGRELAFSWTNETGEFTDFRTIGAVICDAQGRMIDVILSTFSRGACAVPGETLRFEKELPPYITREMADSAVFEAFAYQMGGK